MNIGQLLKVKSNFRNEIYTFAGDDEEMPDIPIWITLQSNSIVMYLSHYEKDQNWIQILYLDKILWGKADQFEEIVK